MDYFLYGPAGLHAKRDLSFGKPWDSKHIFSFPANRFILSGSARARRMEIEGADLKEKYRNYYTLIPSWIALRYDRRPFKMWESYFPFLKDRLSNPLYYSDLPAENESLQINQILLKRVKKAHKKRFLILTTDPVFKKMYETAEIKPNTVKPFEHTFFFPYKVFSHQSSLGNELTAHVYFYALTGRKKFKLNIFKCAFNPKAQNAPPHFLRTRSHVDLKKTKYIFIGTRQIILGELRLNSPDHHYKKSSFFQNKPKNIKSLIGFSNSAENNFGMSPYYPLPFEPGERAQLKIIFPGKKSVPLPGKLRVVDISKKIFNFHWKDIKTLFNRDKDVFNIFFPAPSGFINQARARLFIDDYPLGDLLWDQTHEAPALKLHPRKTPSFLIMGPARPLSERRLPSGFPLYVHYFMEDGLTVKSLIPHWTCRRKTQTFFLAPSDFLPLTSQN